MKADVSHWANSAHIIEMTEITHLDARRSKTGLTQVAYGVSEGLNDLLLELGTSEEIHDGLLQMTGHAVEMYTEQLPYHNEAIEDVLVAVGMDITFKNRDISITALVNSHERTGTNKGITTFVGFVLPSEENAYIRERSPHSLLQ